MIGGVVVQVASPYVEVLDTHSFDRCWRILRWSCAVREGDTLWWQSFQGYLTRPGEFEDFPIGPCRPADGPKKATA